MVQDMRPLAVYRNSMTDDELIAAARAAAEHSYSPYSGFAVGAALRFADGRVFTGTNIENAAYGPTVCAERVAVFKAMSEGVRGGLEVVAVTGPLGKGGGAPITPCGVCRQVLTELAQLGGTDPDILCVGDSEVRKVKLTELLPDAFGPASLK